MAKFSDAMLDPKLIADGALVPWRNGIRLRLRPLHNPELVAFVRDREGRPVLELPDGSHAFNLEDPTFREAVARFVLVDWDGVDAEDGSGPEPYTPEAALAYFEDPRLPHFLRETVDMAVKNEHFRWKRAEADAGN